MPADSEQKAAFKTRVGTGSALFLADVDGRSLIARRFRELVTAHQSDLGGADRLSEGQNQLIRRAAALAVQAEHLEMQMARGEEVDLALYQALANTQRRLLSTLGLERRQRNATPTLAEVLSNGRANDAG